MGLPLAHAAAVGIISQPTKSAAAASQCKYTMGLATNNQHLLISCCCCCRHNTLFALVVCPPPLLLSVTPAVIVRQRKPWRRKEGTYIYFEDNAGVIVNPKGEMKGEGGVGAAAGQQQHRKRSRQGEFFFALCTARGWGGDIQAAADSSPGHSAVPLSCHSAAPVTGAEKTESAVSRHTPRDATGTAVWLTPDTAGVCDLQQLGVSARHTHTHARDGSTETPALTCLAPFSLLVCPLLCGLFCVLCSSLPGLLLLRLCHHRPCGKGVRRLVASYCQRSQQHRLGERAGEERLY